MSHKNYKILLIHIKLKEIRFFIVGQGRLYYNITPTFAIPSFI